MSCEVFTVASYVLDYVTACTSCSLIKTMFRIYEIDNVSHKMHQLFTDAQRHPLKRWFILIASVNIITLFSKYRLKYNVLIFKYISEKNKQAPEIIFINWNFSIYLVRKTRPKLGLLNRNNVTSVPVSIQRRF